MVAVRELACHHLLELPGAEESEDVAIGEQEEHRDPQGRDLASDANLTSSKVLELALDALDLPGSCDAGSWRALAPLDVSPPVRIYCLAALDVQRHHSMFEALVLDDVPPVPAPAFVSDWRPISTRPGTVDADKEYS